MRRPILVRVINGRATNTGAVHDAAVHSAFAHAAVPMALVDADRRIVELNDAGTALLGADRRQVVGIGIDEVLPGVAGGNGARTPAQDDYGLEIVVLSPAGVGSASSGSRGCALSARQRQVLAELADGKTASEVADALFIAPETVRRHVANARERLDARSRVHAVAKALRAGEID